MNKKNVLVIIGNSLRMLLVAALMMFYLPSLAQDHENNGKHLGWENKDKDHGKHDHDRGNHCKANFKHISDTSLLGVRFFANQHTSGTTYFWTFGDGDSSTLRNPVHSYSNAGTYQVCLTVTDSSKHGVCSATDCDSIRVQVVCNANFSAFADSVLLGVQFKPAPNYSITMYSWDFGDGSTSTDRSPVHVYRDTGTYYICLTVKDSTSAGILCTDTVCKNIHITAVCDARFFAARSEHDTTLTYHFFSRLSSPGSFYAWDFGDGSTSSSQNPVYTFSDTGTYVVCLTVTDSIPDKVFCQTTWCDTLHVSKISKKGDHDGDDDGDDDEDDDDHRFAALNTSQNMIATIYPNPLMYNGVLHIENANGAVTFKVYESTGRVVMLKNISNGDYLLSKDDFVSGLYFYEINDALFGTLRGKFIIQ